MKLIRILLVDDHRIFREGVRNLLEEEVDINIVGEAGSGLTAIKMVRDLKPDVLLLDISLQGDVCSLDIMPQVKAAFPAVKILVLSSHENVAYIRQAFDNGAHGYVDKGACYDDLRHAIHAVYADQVFVSPRLEQIIFHAMRDMHPDDAAPDAGYAGLSPREQEIFRLLVNGLSSVEIADVLCISTKTVDKHRVSIMHKTGLTNQAKMVHFAIRYGLVDPDVWQR